MPPGTRLPTFVLFLIGGVALLLGVQTFMRGGLAGWFGRPLARLAAGLRVSPVGAVLLLLALPFVLHLGDLVLRTFHRGVAGHVGVLSEGGPSASVCCSLRATSSRSDRISTRRRA